MFKFNVNLTDDDYLEYNKFWNFRSHYGKGQIISMRIMLAIMVCVFIVLTLVINGFSTGTLIGVITLVAFLVVMELLLKKYITFTLKANLKNLKKKGKVAYSPSATMEFFEETFTEVTDNVKTEQKYSSVERVSVVRGKAIYLHVNSLASYILPLSAFDNKEQFDSFVEFLNSKISIVDIYELQ